MFIVVVVFILRSTIQVTQWYAGWKSVFPPGLQTHQRVETQFSRGLDLLNAAMEGQPLEPVMQV